jgi:glucoamylase
LRFIFAEDAVVVWSADGWATPNRAPARTNRDLKVWFTDLPTAKFFAGSVIEFTFFWTNTQRWEGRNFSVTVSASTLSSPALMIAVEKSRKAK